MSGSQEAEVTYLDEAMRQDVLEEAVDEGFDRSGVRFELAGIGSAVQKSDLGSIQAAVVGEANQAAIGNGDTVDIRSKVLEGGLSAANRFAVDDPILLPDLGRHLMEEWRDSQVVEEFGPEQFGEDFDRQEEVVVGRQPGMRNWSDRAARNEVVDMWVECQIAGPSVEHTQHSDLSAEVTGV